MGCFSLGQSYACASKTISFILVPQIFCPKSGGASVLHRLYLRNKTSQENESNINRKPAKSRNLLRYEFLPRKFCLVYTKLFSSKIRSANNYRTNYRSELGQTALERPKRDTFKKQKKISVWTQIPGHGQAKIYNWACSHFLDLRTDTLAWSCPCPAAALPKGMLKVLQKYNTLVFNASRPTIS